MEDVVVEGVDAQVAELQKVEEEARLWGEADIEARSERILQRAKSLVHVKSGDLRDSLGKTGVKRTGEMGDSYVDVGSLKSVKRLPDGRATFEEYGTRKQQAYPFLRPAVEEEFAQ